MNQTKRLRNAVDILKTVPTMVGYVPQNSLVLLPLTNGHGRACIRMDLPASEKAVSPEEYAIHALRQVKMLPDANQVLFVVFTDRTIEAGRVPFAAHQHEIGAALEIFGVRAKGALTCAANGWSSLDGSENGPVEDLGFGPDSGDLTVAASFDDFASISRGDAAARQNLELALGFVERTDIELDLPTALLAWEKLLAYRDALPLDSLIVNQAILVATLRDTMLTECLLASAAYGEEVATELELVWRALDHEDEQPVEGLITDRLETEPIDLRRVAEAITLLRELIAVMPEADAVFGFSALSWLEWARGSSSLSSHFARQALQRDPTHPLATAVAMMADSGVSPGWISEVGVSGGFTEDDFEELLGAGE